MPGPLIPKLHIITDDAVLARPDFLQAAAELLVVLQRRIALHIRSRSHSANEIYRITHALAAKAGFVQAPLLVNDRIDIALAGGAAGVQIGARSLSVSAARRLLPVNAVVGYSAHETAEAVAAQDAGANFVLMGTIYPSASHPEARPAGRAALEACVEACRVPVLAIGGVTVERVVEVERTGAWGVAVIRAIWDAPDPVQAAEQFARFLYE